MSLMIDNDFFISAPHTLQSHANWHHDVGMPGVYHPRSTIMVKLFFLLEDVSADRRCTLVSARIASILPADFELPKVDDPQDMPSSRKDGFSRRNRSTILLQWPVLSCRYQQQHRFCSEGAYI